MLSNSSESINDEFLLISEKMSALAETRMNYDTALQEAVDIVWQMIGPGICSIVLAGRNFTEIEHVAIAGGSDEFSRFFRRRRIDIGMPDDTTVDQNLLRTGKVIEKYGLQNDGQGVAKSKVAIKYGLQSLLAYPLISDKGVIGYLNYFSQNNKHFSAKTKNFLSISAHHISVLIERLESFTSRHRLQQLVQVMAEMAEARDVDRLLSLILKSSADLVQAPRGTISQLNISTGELRIKDHFGDDLKVEAIHGQGLTNEALKIREPILALDVTDPRWKCQYFEFWADTRSELAVPIVLNNAAVRVGSNIERMPKPIGVLNLESPQANAFTEEDKRLLWSLANYGGILIDGLETDAKQALVAEMQRLILEEADWDGTLEVMLKAIKETLGYDYVNISLVRDGYIKTEHVIGIAPEKRQEFIRLANHPLKSDEILDIQADIVRNKVIEVPALDDPRFDQEIFKTFGHNQLIRVFVPMITPTGDRVIGTVEAGYGLSEHRTHIYEQDVQILKSFIDYAVLALVRRQNLQLGKINHEFEAPVVGIRNNASFLQRWHHRLDSGMIERKCEDILVDCEILLAQIAELEHVLGKPHRPRKLERTLVFRDIIVKTIRQLKPLAKDQGFDEQRMTFNDADIYKINPIYVDIGLLSQVFFNLVINSIKYAGSDPSTFAIRVEVDSNRDAWLVKVKDWGIGVREEYADEIFKEGYRTPEAENQNVYGSGLGLTIARRNMELLGGDLQLTNTHNPTEFTVVLPKSMALMPKEVT